jgi:hypothetical protein
MNDDANKPEVVGRGAAEPMPVQAVAELLSKHPKLFVSVVVVEPDEPDEPIDGLPKPVDKFTSSDVASSKLLSCHVDEQARWGTEPLCDNRDVQSAWARSSAGRTDRCCRTTPGS